MGFRIGCTLTVDKVLNEEALDVTEIEIVKCLEGVIEALLKSSVLKSLEGERNSNSTIFIDKHSTHITVYANG